MAAIKTKASDRAAVIKKLLPAIKKQYKVTVPKGGRPVLETILFAVCLEDAPVEASERWYGRISTEFPDLNEARVSSVNELERIFDDTETADIRAYRLRAVLQYVFEKGYSFEFEGLRKKTLELAMKQLAKIKHITPFVRTYTLQETIGAHLLPIDESSARALIWLGLASPGMSAEEISETLKSAVRKAEAELFCCSVRCIATDRRINSAFFDGTAAGEDGHEAADSMERLADLWKHGATAPKTKPKPKAVVKAAAKPAKAAEPVKAAKAPAAKSPAVKAPAAKPAASKKPAAPAKSAKPAAKSKSAKPTPKAAKKPVKKAR